MAQTRIKDLTEALSADTDDYVVIDGTTNGTRKLSADNIGEKEYDFTTSLTPSIDSRGASAKVFMITPTDSSKVTAANATKLKAYLVSSTIIYPLLVTYVSTTSGTYFLAYLKSIEGSPQNTASTAISGTLHIVAPFEISNVTASM